MAARGRLDSPGASRRTGRGRLGQARAAVFAAAALCSISVPAPWRISPSSRIAGRSAWIQDVERLHALLQTHGDAALRRAFDRGLAEQAIGAEYIAHYLGASTPGLPFDPGPDRPPTIAAIRLPRAGRVQVAEGARRGGAQRSTWTRSSTAASSRRDGGRS